MIRFLVEMEGRSVDLNLLPECEVRNTVIPIATLLTTQLAHVSEPVDIVFCIDSDGFLSLRLRGSIAAVNEARDAIGTQRIISTNLN